MSSNSKSRLQLLIAASSLMMIYTGLKGVSNLQELRRLSDASDRQTEVIAEHLARIDGYQLPVSTVSGEVKSLSKVDRDGVSHSENRAPRSLVQSCVLVHRAFKSNRVDCVGTAVVEPGNGDSSTLGNRYRMDLRGDFQSVLRAMEKINSELPNSCVVSCSMKVDDPAQACSWSFVFDFSESRR